VKKRRF